MTRIEKVTVNIGVGSAGEPIEKAERLLNRLCEQKPVKTKSKKKIPTWGIRKKQNIGVKVTLRGKKALEFLKKALEAKENILMERYFDEHGNFAFGISEYIDLPGTKYDPDIGILGFEVCVTLSKEGYRIKKRKRQKQKVPTRHRVKREEAIGWIKEKFGVKIE